MKFTEWVPRVPNNQREIFENITKMYFTNFQTYLFSTQGERIVEERNSASEYHSITYCSPRYDSLVGFDLYNDEIEGPFLHNIRGEIRAHFSKSVHKSAKCAVGRINEHYF